MESLKKLMEILVSMVDAHKKLLELAREKRSILIAGDQQKLLQIIHRENSCALEIEKLEEKRKFFTAQYLEMKGYAGTSFTLEEITKLQNDPQIIAALNSIAKQLRSLVQEIAHVNNGNQQLIETTLSYLQYTIGMFVQKDSPSGYGPKSRNNYMSLLDAKV
jgi:flagellar biosynthesis/type III secretory pathway chaperone